MENREVKVSRPRRREKKKADILYDKDGIMVVCKPAGLATETASVTEMDLVTYLKNQEKRSGRNRSIHVIERLDQPVQGLLLVATDPKTAKELSQAQKEGRIQKIYYALVQVPECGLPLENEGRLVDNMVKDPVTKNAVVVTEQEKEEKYSRLKKSPVKKAELLYKVLAQKDGKALLQIQLMTGRYHQIRCQLSSRGLPIIGDKRYGGIQGDVLCLASVRLTFPSMDGEVELEVMPKGEEFAAFLDR